MRFYQRILIVIFGLFSLWPHISKLWRWKNSAVSRCNIWCCLSIQIENVGEGIVFSSIRIMTFVRISLVCTRIGRLSYGNEYGKSSGANCSIRMVHVALWCLTILSIHGAYSAQKCMLIHIKIVCLNKLQFEFQQIKEQFIHQRNIKSSE